MPENGDIVNVDFTAKRQPAALAHDLMAELNVLKAETGTAIAEIHTAIAEGERWHRWQERYYRRTLRDLRRQLEEERAANEPTDDEALAALAAFDGPASALEVAATLYRRRPAHSAVVRVGRALSRLAEDGRVARVRVSAHGEERNRWQAVRSRD